MQDRIEKRLELQAPISRVWRALTDYREFGQWFRVKLEGPFVPGQVSRGWITYPGCEHIRWEALVRKMEHERLFSFTWPHPKSFEKTDSPPTTRANRPRSSNSGWSRLRAAPCLCSRSQVSTNCPTTAAKKCFAGTMVGGPSR